LPVSNREIVDSFESALARRAKTFERAVFISVNRIAIVDLAQTLADFSIKLAQNRIRAEPAGFMFRDDSDCSSEQADHFTRRNNMCARANRLWERATL